jgi:hypothetical protein
MSGSVPVSNVQAQSGGSDYADHALMMRNLLNRISTAMPVMVQAVSSPGGLNPVGFVDVLPLVNQLDGNGQLTPHVTVYHLPYFRLQGGANAVIIDPQANDIGLVVFASHDISSVKATKKQSNPGSRRRYNMADGIYIGGILNGTPTQYVLFDSTGITLVSPTAIMLQAPNVTLDSSGNLATKGEITAKTGASSVKLSTHKHGTGTAAAGTVAPTPGT